MYIRRSQKFKDTQADIVRIQIELGGWAVK